MVETVIRLALTEEEARLLRETLKKATVAELLAHGTGVRQDDGSRYWKLQRLSSRVTMAAYESGVDILDAAMS